MKRENRKKRKKRSKNNKNNKGKGNGKLTCIYMLWREREVGRDGERRIRVKE